MVEGLTFSSIGQNQQEKRVCQRIEHNRSVQLRLADGHIINGLTDDVSLGGLKIITRDNIENTMLTNQSQQNVVLQIKYVDGQLSSEYPCSIARLESGAICLKLDKKKAVSFGMLLTKNMFRRK
ncbi:MAG: PilZ domain-containing protein [gamma proteobacterium symbiont of Bathyaustriella thionipta]|nr:PilZ domain-containing protein [gamma proteobacterium symbiont of Bathyaustriella thionipta]MCU7949257.1 PilZ domain-containing protein [gamma proteobacterium symbiont of Bathyaustriella thionipta]MCU7953681.1 PilZ domain-containing protein [gamma proteobacterium symbiont of Bathyaustriella thionipta]MCU7955845.1 PilZ domain-containing protein [gamma proteobacterium symbiont of Bathyaustriella thionipta]MCU7966927.1 PilZ domain-containing protein [gamma proteobacterium symbiont of Bathyaustr